MNAALRVILYAASVGTPLVNWQRELVIKLHLGYQVQTWRGRK